MNRDGSPGRLTKLAIGIGRASDAWLRASDQLLACRRLHCTSSTPGAGAGGQGGLAVIAVTVAVALADQLSC